MSLCFDVGVLPLHCRKHKYLYACFSLTSWIVDNLGKESPLETCYYLGKMLEKSYPLAKPKKGADTGATYPVLG
jgi:hypothetical protein